MGVFRNLLDGSGSFLIDTTIVGKCSDVSLSIDMEPVEVTDLNERKVATECTGFKVSMTPTKKYGLNINPRMMELALGNIVGDIATPSEEMNSYTVKLKSTDGTLKETIQFTGKFSSDEIPLEKGLIKENANIVGSDDIEVTIENV